MGRNLGAWGAQPSEVAHFAVTSALSDILPGALHSQSALKCVEGTVVLHTDEGETTKKWKT